MNQLFAINKITAALFVSSLAGLAAADTATDIEQRIKQIGRINIETMAAPEASTVASTTTATSTPETIADDTPTTTATSTPEAQAKPVAAAAAAPAADSAIDAAALYSGVCVACHAAGVGGAPILGQPEAWALRIAKGEAALLESAIKGIAGTTMMPRGGSSYSDEELAAVVSYMITNSQ